MTLTLDKPTMVGSYINEHPRTFKATLLTAQNPYSMDWSANIAAATTPAEDLPDTGVSYWLHQDGLSGFGVKDSGELIALFSRPKGRGDDLVATATTVGAWFLDCFDDYLPSLYARHGFRETHREANWTAGEPDVVYMALCPFAAVSV